jgi:hypothetical protein
MTTISPNQLCFHPYIYIMEGVAERKVMVDLGLDRIRNARARSPGHDAAGMNLDANRAEARIKYHGLLLRSAAVSQRECHQSAHTSWWR